MPFSNWFSLCWISDANRKEDSLHCDGVSGNSYGVLYSVCPLTGSLGRPLFLTIDSGLLANLSTMLLTSSIGRWADKHPSRLQTLRLTICVQRVTICLACFGWSFVLSTLSSPGKLGNRYSGARTAVMCVLVALGMVERLSAVANNIVIERDWVRKTDPTLLRDWD